MANQRSVAGMGAVRQFVGTSYNTPTGSQASVPEEPLPNDTDVQAKRTKKLQMVASELKRMRYFRRQYDLRRAHYYRQYLGQRDDRFYPDNVTKRSNTFVPYPFSTVENIVARTMDAFFSMEEWFEVKEKPPYSSEEQADQMSLALTDKLHKAGLVNVVEQLIRNLVIYGNASIKVDWDFGFETITRRQPIYAQEPAVDPMTGQPQIDPTTQQPAMQPIMGPDGQPIVMGYEAIQERVPKSCPRITVIDVFDYLYDPDGAYEAHLTERTWKELQDEQEASLEAAKTDPNRQPAYFPEGLASLKSRLANEDSPDEIIIRLAEFWNKNDNTWTIMTFGEDPEGISFKDLRASFRATAYSPYKRRIYGGETIMLWDGENPFFHKRSPILHTDFIKLPNEAFGLGAIEIISDLSEALNRFTNMIADNWNIGINHRYAFDINAEIDHESLNNFNIPGGRVGVVGNPNDMIMPLPQFTPATGDYQILEVYRGMVEMASGVSDFYQKGVGGSAGNKTATGIQQIIGESNYRLKMFIRNMEIDILQPLLEMCASMIQQFVDKPWSVENPKAQQDPNQPANIQIDPKELIGTYQFDIVAANYATSKVVRQRNLMALAKIISESPYVNEYNALRELLKTFDIKHIDQLLLSPEQVQQNQQQQMQQQMMMAQMQHQMEMEKINLQGDKDALVASVSPSPIAGGGSGDMTGSPIGGSHIPNNNKKGKKPGGKHKGGKPPKMQMEGKIPGQGLSGNAHQEGADLSLQKLGLEGMEG